MDYNALYVFDMFEYDPSEFVDNTNKDKSSVIEVRRPQVVRSLMENISPFVCEKKIDIGTPDFANYVPQLSFAIFRSSFVS